MARRRERRGRGRGSSRSDYRKLLEQVATLAPRYGDHQLAILARNVRSRHALDPEDDSDLECEYDSGFDDYGQ